MLWVAHGLVEINVAIGFLVDANPLVHGLTGSLLEEAVVVEALAEGSDSGEIDLQATGMCLGHHLLETFNQFLCHLLTTALAASDIVDALEDDQRGDPLLTEDVAVEPLQGRLAQSAPHHAVAADAEVEHSVFLTIGCCQRLGHDVGPAVLQVGGRPTPVGDGVADDSDALLSSAWHVDGRDAIPVVDPLRDGERCLGLGLSADDIRRGARSTVRSRVLGRGTIIDGHGQPLQGFERIGTHIAHGTLSGLNGDRPFATE